MMKQAVVIAILVLSFMSLSAQDETASNEMIIHVAPYTQSCTGVAPQECLIVSFEDRNELSFFYSGIDGFDFEEGFEYTLRVNVTERKNVPADAPALEYELVEVIQQFPAQLDGKIWELQSLNGTDIEDPEQYTLMLTENGLTMKADCNTVLGDLTLNPFSIETTISTRAMCPEDSLDTAYLNALNATHLMSISNGELILQSNDGQLRFTPPNIDGTEWMLTRVLGISMMLELDDTTLYTLYMDESTVDLNVACNTASGTIKVDGGVLHFDQIAITKMFCTDAPLINTIFPPEKAVYYITESGHLILEDNMTTLYEFTSAEAE